LKPRSPNFSALSMQTSDDGREWRDFCSGEVYRYQEGDKQAESLRVFSSERWGERFWRVEIVNGNDAPLAGAKPVLLTIPHFVAFYPQSGHSYSLIYGNSAASLPHYDLSRTLDYHAESAATPASLGDEEATANYLDPRPFTERHPILLWVALIVAVIILAWAAFRALRTPTTTAS